jgi:hypothetical protein
VCAQNEIIPQLRRSRDDLVKDRTDSVRVADLFIQQFDLLSKCAE